MSFFRRVTRAVVGAHLLPVLAGVVVGAAAYRYYANRNSENRQSQMQFDASVGQSQEAYSPRTPEPQLPHHEAARPAQDSQGPGVSTPGRTQITILPRDTSQIYPEPNRDGGAAVPVEANRGAASVASPTGSELSNRGRGTVR